MKEKEKFNCAVIEGFPLELLDVSTCKEVEIIKDQQDSNNIFAQERKWSRKYYLDTSFINAIKLKEEDKEEKQAVEDHEAAIEFLNRIERRELIVAKLVMKEIKKTPFRKRKRELKKEIKKNNIKIEKTHKDVMKEASYLAQYYIENDCIPKRELNDAIHVAIATILRANILLSYNRKHLLKKRITDCIDNVNLKYDYDLIIVARPQEV